jgi:hypothetical protein
MKYLITVLALISSSALFAAGSFHCEVSLNNGTKYEVTGCLSHVSMGICSPVSIWKNDALLAEFAQDQVDGIWFEKNTFLLNVKDENFTKDVLRIEFYGQKNAKNKMNFSDRRKLSFKDLKCMFE